MRNKRVMILVVSVVVIVLVAILIMAVGPAMMDAMRAMHTSAG